MLNEKEGVTSPEDRKRYAKEAFATSSHYDSAIYNYFARENGPRNSGRAIRKADIYDTVKILIRKEYSLVISMLCFLNFMVKKFPTTTFLDIDAAVNLIDEFTRHYFCHLKT